MAGVFMRAFAVHDVVDGEPRHEQVEFIHPFDIADVFGEELEGYMYELALIVREDYSHDWITVVAYDATTSLPIRAIDFGRRYERSVYRDEFSGWVWDPSRDYWSGESELAAFYE